MELKTIAKPYAKAVLDNALENKSNDKWLKFFEALEVLFANAELLALMHSPKLKKDDKVKTISELVKKIQGELSKEQQNFIKLVVENDKVGAIVTICEMFRQMEASGDKKRRFNVITAYPLDSTEEKKLLKRLSDKFNCEASLVVDVQKDLVGGFIVKDGDVVINASINAQLEELSHCLA